MMRTFLKLAMLCTFLFIIVGSIVALVLSASGAVEHMRISFDQYELDGPVIALAAGAITALALTLAGMIVVVVLAWVAMLVPLTLALVAGALLVAMVIGLTPVVLPVLLVVGACVLLSRWAKRRRTEAAHRSAPAQMPASSAP